LAIITARNAFKTRKTPATEECAAMFQFWDKLQATPTTRNANAMQEAQARTLQVQLTEETQDIIDYILKKKVTHLLNAPNADNADGKPKIAKEVFDALIVFVKVRTRTYCM
jgi:hypothetical protein